jgi:signal transduction histidine kinase/HPt (histidine-containing phosphotransfer) domain-containing protein/ActR/RegA family two-component response regulator
MPSAPPSGSGSLPPAAIVDPSAQRRKEYMELLLANVPENILLFDGEGRLARCSAHFLRLTKTARFELIAGWHFTRLYRLFGDDEFINEAIRRFERVKEGRKTIVSNVQLNFAAQREAHLYTLHSAPMLTEEGALDGVIVVLHDNAEHAHQEADARTRAMLNASPLASSLWSEAIEPLDCNDVTLRMFELSSVEEFKHRILDLMPPAQPGGEDSGEMFYGLIKKTFTSGREERELLSQLPSGAPVPTELTFVRIKWGNKFGVVCYSRDLREIKASEAKRLDAEKRSRELEVQTRAAKVASEAKSQFLATMSHEIRTPMNAIIGMSELIRTNNLDATQKDFINDIRKMSHALLHIINGILDFSKIEAGKLELAPVHFDLTELYDNICSINRFAAESSKLKFTASFAPDVPRVLYGDDVRMRQVITNILGNAIKYTRRGEVDFRVERLAQQGQDWLSFTITDTGIGIREKDIPRLFDSFAQFDRKTNRSQTGTGLGLPITQSLVRLMRGHIKVKSEYGQGSTFTILLPLTPGDPAQVEAAVQKQPEFRAHDASVLVVDDNQINLKVALAHLANYGILADTAMSGLDAITKVEHKDYDLVFMDQMMPGIDGLEATQHIRALGAEKYRALPIVALTANAVRGAEQIFFAAGMNDFISKPINGNELSHILMKWLPTERIVVTASAAHPLPAASTPALQRAIQRGIGLKNATGDESLYRQLLVDFLRDHADDTARLRAHLAAGEQADALRIAHTLKNVAATIGALDLRQSAAHLESALKSKRQDDVLLSALDTHLATVTHELAGEFGTQDASLRRSDPAALSTTTEGSPVPDFAPDAMLALVDTLAPLLERGNTVALNYTNDIRRLLSALNAPLTEHCAQLIEQIEDFDFSRAQQTLLSIRDIINAASTHRRTT